MHFLLRAHFFHLFNKKFRHTRNRRLTRLVQSQVGNATFRHRSVELRIFHGDFLGELTSEAEYGKRENRPSQHKFAQTMTL